MLKRFISGLIGIGLAIFIISYGKTPFLIAVAFLTLVGLMEFFKMAKMKGIKTLNGVGYLSGLIIIFLAYFNSKNILNTDFFMPVLFFSIFTIFFIQIIKNGIFSAIANVGVTFFGIFYVAGLISHTILLRYLENPILPGKYAIWLALICTWSTDTFAYFVGSSIGKRKITPQISPKKTLEGFLGGISGSCLAGSIFGIVVGVSLLKIVFMALLVGVIGQLGDLFESCLKRDAGVKDSGSLIPGHGGVLDRFDSVLFTVPLIFYLVKLLF